MSKVCGDPGAVRERDALAEEVAYLWGWPSGEGVLARLRGDRTAAPLAFTDEAYLKYLGVQP